MVFYGSLKWAHKIQNHKCEYNDKDDSNDRNWNINKFEKGKVDKRRDDVDVNDNVDIVS